MDAYDYSANQQAIAGSPGAGGQIYEVDWAYYHQLHGAGAVWPEIRINVAPNCPYRSVYLNAYNDVGTAGAYTYGELKAMFNNRVVAKIPLTFNVLGTATALSGLPTGAAFMPSFQTGATAQDSDMIVFSRINNANYIGLPPFRLVVTADTLIWTPLQQVASAGNACTFFACKSMRATY